MSKPNPLADYITTLVEPFPNRYTMGEFTIAVTPRADLDDDGLSLIHI